MKTRDKQAFCGFEKRTSYCDNGIGSKEGERSSQSEFQFSSAAQLCPTLCNSMNCNTPVFPVHHQLPALTQIHVHRVSDATQQSHPPSPLIFNLSQHQGLFKWVSSLHQVAKVLEFQLQHHSFQWIFRTDFLLDRLVGSPCSLWDSQEFSPTPHSSKASILWRSAFFTIQLSHPYMTTGKWQLWLDGSLLAK